MNAGLVDSRRRLQFIYELTDSEQRQYANGCVAVATFHCKLLRSWSCSRPSPLPAPSADSSCPAFARRLKYNTIQCNTKQYSGVQYSKYNTIQYNCNLILSNLQSSEVLRLSGLSRYTVKRYRY